MALLGTASGRATDIGLIEFLGSAELPARTILEDTLVGGLSGLAWDPQTGRFLAISDDPGHRGPVRFYDLEVQLAGGRLEEGGLRMVDVTPLRQQRRGRPLRPGTSDTEAIVLRSDGTLFVASEGFADDGVPPFIAEFGREDRKSVV